MAAKRFAADVSAEEIRALSPEPPVEAVSAILRAVRERGDDALLEFERDFGAAEPQALAVSQQEIDAALESLDAELIDALKTAIENVRQVATASLTEGERVELPQGQSIEYSQFPVARAGAYVPGGRGSYPSTAVMCVTTALAAGVPNVCVVSPVREDGKVDSAVLAVCGLLGVSEVYATGGAQAVAALAYGTDTIAPVDVIVGPGNSYVQEAKRQLVGTVGIDGVAGPSELVVVADSTADVEAVSLDLLAQGEHGPDSLVVLISPEIELLDAVAARIAEIDAEAALVQAADLPHAVALADAIAPEHMQIIAAAEDQLAEGVRNAGCLFVGANAATAFGDYVTGSNHVLPTGGAARFTSALSVATFRRRMATVSIPDSAVSELAEAGATIADAEGFPLHGRSMEVRKK